ncbi:bZIP transcription factor 53-like [Gastrolobium bilobum]|uniref:bZIP transcription factor 53-like n=1 Tax=Gastrolobium bilobum TaxID=150636 RepID=UPI002AAFCA5A|nr:bZIP transcription factor 53-like [Gastrolobium bilobum]
MLSALPASDTLFGNPFSAFDGCFTPWDGPDFCLAFKPNSPKPVTSSSGSDDPNKTHVASVMDERRRRRMISNRESARRSRMRKQKHLENLRNQVNLVRIENRELSNGLQFLLHHCDRVRTENDWLRSERTRLRQKLSNISQILVLQQLQPSSAWPCNVVTAE